jgi:hypothetical protein
MAAAPPREPGRGDDRDRERRAAQERIRHQETWVDLQLRRAMERGDFDDLPGYGKPLEGLTGEHDPDWWVRRLVEREQITGVVPASVRLRREDAELDDRLDRLAAERDVRAEVQAFNERVLWARYRPPEGPPLVTLERDVEEEVARWRARRERRRAAQSAGPAAEEPIADRRRGWLRRRRRQRGSLP